MNTNTDSRQGGKVTDRQTAHIARSACCYNFCEQLRIIRSSLCSVLWLVAILLVFVVMCVMGYVWFLLLCELYRSIPVRIVCVENTGWIRRTGRQRAPICAIPPSIRHPDDAARYYSTSCGAKSRDVCHSHRQCHDKNNEYTGTTLCCSCSRAYQLYISAV